MPDKKLTDNEIIKALECCNQNDCKTCPYGKYNTAGWCCMPKLRKDTLSLINRLQAELERLKAEIFALRDDLKAEQETAYRQRIETKMLKKQLPTKIKIRRWFK